MLLWGCMRNVGFEEFESQGAMGAETAAGERGTYSGDHLSKTTMRWRVEGSARITSSFERCFR